MELQLVLEKAGGFFDDAQHRASAAQFESGPPSPADSKLLHPVRIADGPPCRAVAKPYAHAVGAQTLGISATGTVLVYLDVVMANLHIYGAVVGCQCVVKD